MNLLCCAKPPAPFHPAPAALQMLLKFLSLSPWEDGAVANKRETAMRGDTSSWKKLLLFPT